MQLTELDREIRKILRDSDEVILENEMEGAMEYRSRWILLDIKYKSKNKANPVEDIKEKRNLNLSKI